MESSTDQPSSSSSCWSHVVKNQPASTPNPKPTAQIFVDSSRSREGISVAVLDANAVIHGGEKLNNFADKLVTVPEVVSEIRDPVSRHRLAFIPFTIDSMDPTPESLNRVIKFARATGDLQTLSDVDLKLIALTYTLEAQIHGTKHLRDAPPPVHTVNLRRLPEKDLPGWGSNVPNLAEWEALEHDSGDGLHSDSRILPLKDISLNIIPANDQSENGSVGTGGETFSENTEDVEDGLRKPRKYPPKKKEVKIEGKKMVADGVDASQGTYDDEAGDWMPAVSRSTHRRFLRRKARREYYEALAEKDRQQDLEKRVDDNNIKESSGVDELLHQRSEEENVGNVNSEEIDLTEVKNGDENISLILNQMRLEECSAEAVQEMEASSENEGKSVDETGEIDFANAELDHLEISSQTNQSIDASYIDGDDSEHSWMLKSLSESSVACVTSDFAMQNVLLQMGLRLVAPGGMQIRQLHRWILKCHACYTVTAEIGRIFCPKCGNGGTLRKVAVTVGENGIVLADHRPRIKLRGTKFSLPLPQGGRDAIAKNIVLREDQLPQKFLYPRRKKKTNKEGDDFFCSDDIFVHHTGGKAPFQPPIKKALAVFSGKRNPNDNHFSRPKH